MTAQDETPSLNWRAAVLRAWRELLVLAVVIGGAGTLYYVYGGELSLEALARQERAFRAFYHERTLLTYAIAFAAYVAVTALSLPLATGLTVLYAWLFQSLWRSLLLISFASTAGATLAFLLSRYLLRGMVRRMFGQKLARIDDAFQRDGGFYLLSLRLLPVVPFFVINFAMGVLPIRVWTFWWCTQLGTLPATTVYAFAGTRLPSLEELSREGAPSLFDWQLLAAFVLLALLPLLLRALLARFHSPDAAGE